MSIRRKDRVTRAAALAKSSEAWLARARNQSLNDEERTTFALIGIGEALLALVQASLSEIDPADEGIAS